MKRMHRQSRAVWTGTGAEGSGKVTTGSGALDALPYSVVTRFVSEDGKAGTNPEELIAAAHASCFAMALSFGLTGAGHPPEQLDVTAHLTMESPDVHWTVTGVKLVLAGKVPGIELARFTEIAEGAKANCPISKLLRCDITLEASLV
jgi:osmotically inducible protein OsmC